MRLSRIFVDQDLSPISFIEIRDQAAHYLSKVLRLNVEAPIILFNGNGFEYTARIASISKKHVEVEVLQQSAPMVESTLTSVLALGVSRGERMDYAIQKSTELGVSEIQPLFTERGEVKLKGDRLEKRQAHWQQIAISACEQSGRVSIPVVHRPIQLPEWLKACDCTTRLVLDHRQAQPLDGQKPAGKVAILIGPEGGFAESELKAAFAAGFKGLTLGPRVLRTETAPVTALAVLQYVWGDF